MPNRIIKESTFTSDRIAQLSDFEFRLWVGLITQADDAGRGDARPAIIKGRVFALRERVTIKDIDSALHVLAAHGCVSLYTVGGKPYYAFPNWAAHQRVRDAKPKYPGADERNGDFDNSPQSAATRGNSPQSAATRGNSPQSAATRGLNPIQSESNPNPNPNPTFCAAPKIDAPPPEVAHPPVIALPLNDKTNFLVTQGMIDEWSTLYPAVDVLQALRSMRGWFDANPTHKKTKTGIARFINNWLSKEQNKARPTANPDSSRDRKEWSFRDFGGNG